MRSLTSFRFFYSFYAQVSFFRKQITHSVKGYCASCLGFCFGIRWNVCLFTGTVVRILPHSIRINGSIIIHSLQNSITKFFQCSYSVVVVCVAMMVVAGVQPARPLHPRFSTRGPRDVDRFADHRTGWRMSRTFEERHLLLATRHLSGR